MGLVVRFTGVSLLYAPVLNIDLVLHQHSILIHSASRDGEGSKVSRKNRDTLTHFLPSPVPFFLASLIQLPTTLFSINHYAKASRVTYFVPQ